MPWTPGSGATPAASGSGKAIQLTRDMRCDECGSAHTYTSPKNGLNKGIQIEGTDDFCHEVQVALAQLERLSVSGVMILSGINLNGQRGNGVTIRSVDENTCQCCDGDWPTFAAYNAGKSWDLAAPGRYNRTGTPGPGVVGDGTAVALTDDLRGPGQKQTVFWSSEWEPNPTNTNKVVNLAHELIHGVHGGRGESLIGYKPCLDIDKNLEEERTTGCLPYIGNAAEALSENAVRKEWNAVYGTNYPPRNDYGTPL